MAKKILGEKDHEILNHLRTNNREKITQLAKKINLPVTTVYSKLRSYEKNIIRKHTCLIDFNKLEDYKSIFLIMKGKERKKELMDFLSHHPSVNSLFRVDYDHDFLAECIFKDEKEVTNFLDQLNKYGTEMQMLNVVEEIRKEDFVLGKKEGENHDFRKQDRGTN